MYSINRQYKNSDGNMEYGATDRDKISLINNKETEGNVPSVIVPNG